MWVNQFFPLLHLIIIFKGVSSKSSILGREYQVCYKLAV